MGRRNVGEGANPDRAGKPRRRALWRAGGLLAALGAPPWLQAVAQPTPASAAAATQPEADTAGAAPRSAREDRDVSARRVTFAARDATLQAYLAHPRAPARVPLVLVCHDQRGLRPHVEALARRLARAGYAALAIDLLSREGGSAVLAPDRMPALLAAVPASRHVDDCMAALDFARNQPFVRARRAGIVGLGLGGGVAWRVAAATPDIRALVSFYGLPVTAAEAARIHAAVLAIHAGRDERVNAMLPRVESAMREHGGTLKVVVYPDVAQGFLDETGDRYDAAAARAAWTEARAWLGRYLRAG